MASTKQTYPSITAKAWWALRKTFRQSLPTQVTPSYLATALGMQENSAKANVLPGLKAVGLIKPDGAPTSRANRWRDDQGYIKVCKEIREEIYPAELRDAIPDPSSDGDSARKIEDWFMRTTRGGKSAATKMVALYSLLTEADPSGGEKPKARKPEKTKPSGSRGESTAPAVPEKQEPVNQPHTPPHGVRTLDMLDMRLNLEIRIDASVTPEQIDQIFASMAKHLYRRDDEGQ